MDKQELFDPRTGEAVGFVRTTESLILDPLKGTGRIIADWTIRTGKVAVGVTPRIVCLVRARRELIISLGNFQFYDAPEEVHGYAMAIITQEAGGFNKRLLPVRSIKGASGVVEAVEDVTPGPSEQEVQSHAMQKPKDFWSHAMNVLIRPGQCLGFLACTDAGVARCEVTVAGQKDGSRWTMGPGWKSIRQDDPAPEFKPVKGRGKEWWKRF